MAHTYSDKRFTALLSLTLVVTLLGAIASTIFVLYQTALLEERERLTETVQSQARLIEAVARFDANYASTSYPGSPEEATLSKIREAHRKYHGVGDSGEFTLGRLGDKGIEFLLHHRYHPDQTEGPPEFIKMGSAYAIPMQLALRQKSGTTIAADYAGTEVLAAYGYVREMDYGIVAKIDLSEVQAPFVKAAAISFAIGLMLASFGAFGFTVLTRPVIKKIRDSEEKLKLAMEATRDGMWDWDIGSNRVEFSIGWSRMVGEDSVIQSYSGWESRIHPDDKSRILQSLEAHLQGETPHWQQEHRLKHANGQWKWVLGRGEVVSRDADNNPLRMVGTMTDIEERKKIEAQREIAEKRMASILNSTAEAIYGIDASGKCTFVNPSCVRMLGYASEQELIDQNIHELIHHTRSDGSHFPPAECNIHNVASQGVGAHSVDDVLWRKDGSSFPVEYWSYPMEQDGEISGAVVTFLDITERLDNERKLKHLATHDSLTGLLNHSLFEKKLQEEIGRAQRYRHPLSLIFIDLDHFKDINDQLGHRVGDEVLQMVSKILNRTIRKNDTAARYGGEEFVLLLPETGMQDAQEFAERLRCEICDASIVVEPELSVDVTASFGVATYPDSAQDWENLVRAADNAMYRAKEGGRNLVVQADRMASG